MMKQILRLTALLMTLMMIIPSALAASTPTPPPVAIEASPVQPPKVIRDSLDIAYAEWETLAGKTLPRVNKYTEWRGKGVGFGWCAGYITWCMMEAGVPMYEQEHFLDDSHDTAEGFFPVEGVMHVQEAGVGKLLRSYQRMNRTTRIPQPGYILVYGCSYNKVIHVGLVYDVVELGEGRYRITTLEGNMSSRVKMYVRDYDMNAEVNTNNKKSSNLSEIPEDARVLPESDHVDYSIPSSKPSDSASGKYIYYVHCFLMPWVPGDPALPGAETPVPEATPAPTAEPTPEVTAVPPVNAETPAPTEIPGEADAPAAEAEVTATPVPAEEPEAAATAEPAPGAPTWPCTGKDGACPYITYRADDAFCRHCDRNDNGVEDSRE